jgi:hypothetical protein
MTLTAALTLGLAALTGCRDFLTALPGGEHLAAALGLEGEAAAPPRGCTHLDFTLTGNDGPQFVERAGTADCGPLKPVIAGTATYDRQRAVLRVPVALVNGGTTKLRAPARLFGWTDSLVVIEAPGLALAPAGTYASILATDTTLAADVPAFPGAAAWRFDSLLVTGAAPTAQLLAPGDTSAVRWLELSLHNGVRKMRVTFWAEARPARPPVPAVAPDSVPPWVYADSNIVDDEVQANFRYAANAIWIEFRPNASIAQRETALDAVAGEVVGGRSSEFGEGLYLVRIEAGRRFAPLAAAVDSLNTMPQVAYAIYLTLIERRYRQPQDADAFAGRWGLDPDSALGGNWALEDGAFPMAWGCSVGDSITAVAVVDGGFHEVSDVMQNVSTSGRRYAHMGEDTTSHGTAVASVLAARGDNALKITGAAWRADLRLYYDGNDIVASLKAVERAAREGARIINVSSGQGWRRPPTGSQVERQAVFRNARMAREILGRLDSAGIRPLIVEAAGNEKGADALYYSVFGSVDSAQVRRGGPLLRNRILVIGGSMAFGSGPTRDPSLVTTSGPTIDVYAPGMYVGALNKNSQVVSSSGTSLAAPIVSGIAVLLQSFDSKLTAEEMRSLVIEGARRGGRILKDDLGAEHHVVNAYESLKLAAQRKGAPLCGNRVWLQGNAVNVERAGGDTEALFTTSTTARQPNVYHGGRRVHVGTAVYDYDAPTRTWKPATMSTSDAQGGAYRSALGYSHDRDFLGRATPVCCTGGVGKLVVDRVDLTTNKIASAEPMTFGASPEPDSALKVSETCHPDNGCPAYTVYGLLPGNAPRLRTAVVPPAASPRGDFLLVPASFETRTTTFGSWGGCATNIVSANPEYPPDDRWTLRCRTMTHEAGSDSAVVYKVSFGSAIVWQRLMRIDTGNIGWIAVGEDGREFVVGVTRWYRNEKWAGSANREDSMYYPTTTHTIEPYVCFGTIEYRALSKPDSLTRPVISDPAQCEDPSSHRGTIAPRVTPQAPPAASLPRRPATERPRRGDTTVHRHGE